MRFSEREGFKLVRSALQIETVDEPLRNCLWNAIDCCVLQYASDVFSREYYVGDYNFFDLLWTEYYKLRENEKPEEQYRLYNHVQSTLLEGNWYEIYDFIEYAIENFWSGDG